jgi:hypothetical protein
MNRRLATAQDDSLQDADPRGKEVQYVIHGERIGILFRVNEARVVTIAAAQVAPDSEDHSGNPSREIRKGKLFQAADHHRRFSVNQVR